MDLFDIDDAQRMSREEAAAKLHTRRRLSEEQLGRVPPRGTANHRAHPRPGQPQVEVELGDEGENELEVDLTW